MIYLKDITKTFKVFQTKPSDMGVLKSFFSRKYFYKYALDNISFEILSGEMVAYIGPNGAGKSSTIKIMSGILTPDAGECIISGKVPWKNRIEHVKNIGVVFGQRSQLWWDVPVIDSFQLLSNIYQIEYQDYKKKLEELIDTLDLKQLIKIPARQLSLGERMRCELAAALLHAPKILFLDEPTIGLDIISKIAVRNFIRKLNIQNNITVILTSHDMQDIEAIANRVILIGRGKILMDGQIDNLKKKYSNFKTITIAHDKKSFKLKPGINLLKTINGLSTFQIDVNIITVSSAIEEMALIANTQDIFIEPYSIEEIIASLYKELCIS